ncbi:DUF5686 and carboxypeptidase regulatory-like domain-containing protein [Polaribacter porphyrae]|uniref:Carboxypeptidase-like regulatory domain-containing protein n=1 Tax=Polaribacter porphyrae TaxID=1137780 RepID=A0A2S7WQC5_9FLAO|nr:DUF5686 and carboxypeptidase regulatory-like domain-containing protein [Polaribacter porphyrae]PQJ79471.1 hypothetical protein BTO18_09940 [Polaribacter porphyrae]
MKKITFLFLFFCISYSFAQVKGKITNSKNAPLSFVSVYLDKTVTGTTSNDNGDYVLELKKTGKYTIIYQILGYKTVKKSVDISSFPYTLDVVLEEEKVELDEISISTKDNPANRIIRNVIANKDKNTDKYANYTAKFYSRGLTRIKDAPEKFLGQNMGDFGGGLDSTRSGIVYLSETFSNISFQKKPKRFKEKIVASKVSGQDNGVSFNRAEDSNINLYENSIEIFNDLVSPISSNAFSYYKYKLEGTFYDKNGKLINKIKLIPKRKNDRIFNGSIYIVEDDWALYGADLSTTGTQINIPFVNSLGLKQGYNYSEKIDAWVLISQSIEFDIAFLGFKPRGKFSYVYSDYDFAPKFTENTFTNEVLSFEENATKKDTVYWNTLRPVPLTREEVKDYSIKDSIKVVRKSKKYLDSVNKVQNKFGFLSPITGYTYRNSYEKWSLSYNGLLDELSFNTVQGFNASAGLSYFKRLNDKGKWWSAGVNVNYGFSDKRARPTFYFSKKWNNFSRPRFSISGGITTLQFNPRNPISKMDNLIRSLLRRDNYMKIYEKEYARISYSEEIKNGVYFYSSLEYANRKPLFNTTNYSFARQSRNDPYTSNNPLEPNNYSTAPFTAHKIATLNVGARIVFAQKYLSYPDSKFNADNSKYPTLSLNYRKRFAASNSSFNSDLFTGNLRQFINTGNYGDLTYNIRGGLFLKQKDVPIMDLLQANGNQLAFVTDNQLNSFGLLEYYRFFTNDKYAEAHIEHNFRGSILGKVPLLNKLNFHLVGGAKTLFMADTKPYTEYSVGLDNIGFGKWRFLRIDYIRSNYAGIKNDGFVFRLNLLN